MGAGNGSAPDRTVLRLATRGSQLALWQAHHVTGLLRAMHPGLHVEILSVSTEGDRRLDVPLSEIGGKGVFATEVQAALLEGRADLAVHSAKDLPAVTGDGLLLAAVPERGDPRDALVGATLQSLRPGAVVATGSARRRAQLAHLRPDLSFAELRGNMATRLSKAADVDAIVVAAAAFQRLGLEEHLRDVLDVDAFVPQVAQAALAVECRAGDDRSSGLVAAIDHRDSRRCVEAERAFLAELGGDCTLPAGAHAQLHDGALTLRAVLAADIDGPLVVEQATTTDTGAASLDRFGRALATELRSRLGGATP